jgi:hypothetical protein
VVTQAHLLELAALEEKARLTRFERAWKAYRGQFPKPLKVKPGRPDDNVVLSKARVIVDTGVAFLFGKPVAFELERGETTERERWLAACWERNRLMTTLQKLALNGGVCGTPFLRLLPAARRGDYPRAVVLDPAHLTVRWSPEDVDEVVYYRIQFPAIDPKTGKPIVRRTIIEPDGQGWRITDQRSRPDSAVWETIGETPWPYPFAPIAHCQNLVMPNEFWGMSDVEDDILGLIRARNFILSNANRVHTYHGHPKTWGSGFKAADLQTAPDETVVFQSPEAKLSTLEAHGDIAGGLELDRRLDEALHELARIPAIATGKVEDVGQLSGLALRILYGPLVQVTEAKRVTYGELLVEVNRRLLHLGGQGEDLRTTITWPELLPSDPHQERETALLDEQLGVSRETLLAKLGYDAAAEAKKKAEESRADAELGQRLLTAFDRGQDGAPERGPGGGDEQRPRTGR